MTKFLIALTVAAGLVGSSYAAEYLEKSDMQKARAFSPAVIAEGGRTVYLAGQTTLADRSLIHNGPLDHSPVAQCCLPPQETTLGNR